jgi:hypothetical protein
MWRNSFSRKIKIIVDSIEDEPVDADIPWKIVARTDLHRNPAAPQRKNSQRDADGPHQLFAVEDEGDQSECNRENHSRIEQVTHLVGGVDLAQLRFRHQVGEVEAQHAQHAENTERYRDPTAYPPLAEFELGAEVILLRGSPHAAGLRNGTASIA